MDKATMEYLGKRLHRAEILHEKVENLKETITYAERYSSSVEIHTGASVVRISKTEVPLILGILERELERVKAKLNCV